MSGNENKGAEKGGGVSPSRRADDLEKVFSRDPLDVNLVFSGFRRLISFTQNSSVKCRQSAEASG